MKNLSIILVVTLALALTTGPGITGCQDGEAAPTLDSDGDGWSDDREEKAGSDPFNADTDGDGYWDPLDPNPLDSAIPAALTPTSTTIPTPTLIPTPTQSPATSTAATPTPRPSQIIQVKLISDEVINECARQFLIENNGVSGATAYQSADASTFFLTFSIHWETPTAEMKPLAEKFISVVKTRVDVPPDVKIGTGKYSYVTYVRDSNGLLILQGSKCASCDSVAWL